MSEKLSLRIDNGIREIEVNDNGDTITLKLGDRDFRQKVSNMFNTLLQKASDFDNQKAQEILDEIHSDMADGINELFGENACEKIFGKINPDEWVMLCFFNEIMPFVEEFNSKRDRIILKKYNPKRRGNSK